MDGGIEQKRKKKRKNSWTGTTMWRLPWGRGVGEGRGGHRGINGGGWR